MERIRVLIRKQSDAIGAGINPIVILNRVNSNSSSKSNSNQSQRETNPSAAISQVRGKGRWANRLILSRICGYCKKTFTTGNARVKHEMIHEPKAFHCPHPECSRSFTYAHSLQTHINFIHSEERPHVCEFPGCRTKFKSSSNLSTHSRIHQGLRPYICPHTLCNKSFVQLGTLQQHVICIHGSDEKSFECPQPNCNSSFKSASRLRRHSVICHSEEKFQCRFCPRTFRARRNLISHLHCHTKEKPYSCTWPACSKSFSTGSTLQIHLRVHSGQKPFKCRYSNDKDGNKCQMAFRVSSSRKVHEERTHIGIKRLPCKFQGCHLKFFTTSEVTSHLRGHTKEKPHRCDVCKLFYSSTGSLRIHQMKEHKRSQVFSCPHCSKQYFVQRQFQLHVKSHETIRHCRFPKCDMSFNSYKDLTTHHKEEHKGELRLKCPKEGAGCAHRIFTSRRDWAAHIKRHNERELEEKIFAKYWCTFNKDVCNRYFLKKPALDVHMRSHTGERPFKCPVKGCEKASRQQTHLDEHLKRVHRQGAGK